MECCGEHTFNPDIEFCCDEEVGEKSKKHGICVGSNKNDRNSKALWCGKNGTSQRLECCDGKSPYNASLFKCLNNTVVPIAYDICKGEFYDKRKQICCDRSTLYGVPSYQSNSECCGSSLIDKRIKQCCIWSGSAYVQPKTGDCCGEQIYNQKSEICCKGKRIAANENTRCCGDRFYNSSFQLCCHSEKSATPFNRKSEKCCQGLVFSVKDLPKPKCCGNRVYSSRSQACRGGVINRKKESCYRGSQSENSLTKETFYRFVQQLFPAGISTKLKKWKGKKGFPLIYVNLPEAKIYLGKVPKISSQYDDRSA
ncbi:galaxin-like [Saccostrea echinata]|uniref:galaxin-like n=1 Tax=Saccostrea echinata TaxID=191078 RepID=UPI002A80FABB|nr:galaxin-like [Saccostrea echinata]